LPEGIVDRFACEALRQDPALGLQSDEEPVEAMEERPAFDFVQMPNLAQDPGDELRGFSLRLVEEATDMRPAACQDNGALGPALSQSRISAVGIALDRPGKLERVAPVDPLVRIASHGTHGWLDR
jgi:hypothetical protein